MNVAILAAGASDMFCGSCLRDSAMARALIRLGHRATLIPLFAPLRTDGEDVSDPRIFYGGINSWLQNRFAFFRHTPRSLDWLLDRRWLLRWAGNLGARTPPDDVADLTAAIIEGTDGGVRKELHRLVEFLREHVHPQVVSLPNLMFIGAAGAIRESLGVPVVCELTGEDIFLDAMSHANRSRIRELIRARTGHVSRFVSTTDYYAERMAEYLAVPRERIDVVPTGLAAEFFAPLPTRSPTHRPAVGFLARICPEKGFEALVDAMLMLKQRPGFDGVRLRAAGYLSPRDRGWFGRLVRRINGSALGGEFDHLGEVDQAAKIAMLDSIDILSVPTTWPEPKGIYAIEAMARGVPVVQPAHGSFPKLIEQTGGGILVPPADAPALADALAALLSDASQRTALGESGRRAVESQMTEAQMAQAMLSIYQSMQ